MGDGSQQPALEVAVSSAPFQYTDTPSAEAMTNSDEEEFARLTPEGQKCLMEFWNSLPLEGVYCNTTWDTLYCWPPTKAGQMVKESCATVFSDVPDLVNYPEAYAYRECDQAGVWLWGGWTNYSQCLSVIDHKDDNSAAEAVSYITFIGALLSLFTLIITIFIFTYFRPTVTLATIAGPQKISLGE
ncbi:calcitonin receptor-like [Penaeus chinensis]|uniref:calcitonin receptor-like n=1 Tax=Penaeus chinensis TaxID=139456 RepID=UPI001FB7B97A|nr:calcitonin receptor-like [Penaeus chinensis]